jgi:rsbT co-antagonist protein RsbR
MNQLFPGLLTITSPDEDTRRRGRNTVIIAMLLFGLILFAVVYRFSQAQRFTLAFPLIVIVGAIITVVPIWLARRGAVTSAAFLMVIPLTLGIFALMLAFPNDQFTVFLFTVPLLLSIPLLSSRATGLVACLTLALIWTAAALQPNPTRAAGIRIMTMSTILTSAVSMFSSYSFSATLRRLKEAQTAIEAAQKLAAKANETLEVQIAVRTAELQTALAEVQTRATAQTQLLHEVEQQRDVIREMSVPVLPVNNQTLVIPLIGALDSTRLLQIQQQALGSLEQRRARHLLLDITGVPVVDTQVAHGLIQVVQAARLLGAEVSLVGIRPEVAQAIVGLGLNLGAVQTFSDLQEALLRTGKSI